MSVTPEQTVETVREQKAREAYFTASQRQLVWARFKKQRAAMTAATVLIVLLSRHSGAVPVALRPDHRRSQQGLYEWCAERADVL